MLLSRQLFTLYLVCQMFILVNYSVFVVLNKNCFKMFGLKV